MENSGVTPEMGKETTARKGPDMAGAKAALRKANKIINGVGVLAFHLRKIVMAAPVVYAAMKLADYNRANLPEQVGLNLQATGEFAQYIGRNMAVTGPLALTIACLFLMFCSRKATYAWSISIFTLALPILLLVSNLYPA